MRIRSTKPEFWKSERVALLSWEDRLLLKGLESYVDDNGVGRDDVALIVGDLFARDMFANPRETVARVSEGLSRIETAGLIHRYEADGTRLLFVSFWESIQRIDKPGKGRMPRPDGTTEFGDSDIRESVAKPRETVAPGTGEQRNRGTGEQSVLARVTPTADLEAAFAHAYAAWPKKTERKQAFDRFKIAARRRPLAELVGDIVRFGNAYAETTETKFVPALGVWIGHERWTDDLPAARAPRPAPAARPTRGQEHLAYIASLGEPTHQQEIER